MKSGPVRLRSLSDVRVLVVDDHEMVRAGLTLVLSNAPKIDLVGVVASGEQALRVLGEARPDVVLLDFRLTGENGAEVCRELLAKDPSLAVLLFTVEAAQEALVDCLTSGARGVLKKTASAARLVDSIHRVAEGEAVFSPDAAEAVIELARIARHQGPILGLLAPFQLEILRRLSHGWGNRRIATDLHVSEDAIKMGIRAIKRRLGAGDRAQAVALAVKRGII